MSDAPVEMHCMKCKQKTGTMNAEAYIMSNGRIGTRGVCAEPECGTKKNRIGNILNVDEEALRAAVAAAGEPAEAVAAT